MLSFICNFIYNYPTQYLLYFRSVLFLWSTQCRLTNCLAYATILHPLQFIVYLSTTQCMFKFCEKEIYVFYRNVRESLFDSHYYNRKKIFCSAIITTINIICAHLVIVFFRHATHMQWRSTRMTWQEEVGWQGSGKWLFSLHKLVSLFWFFRAILKNMGCLWFLFCSRKVVSFWRRCVILKWYEKRRGSELSLLNHTVQTVYGNGKQFYVEE